MFCVANPQLFNCIPLNPHRKLFKTKSPVMHCLNVSVIVSNQQYSCPGPFINSFIMICESMLSVSQDGLSREICCYQNIDYRYLIINAIGFQILLVSKSIGVFFGGGQNYPPYKTLGWGPVSRCFLRPLRSLTCLAEPSNNSNL